MAFPSLEGMSYSTESGEPILGGSIGINRVLMFFRENSWKQRREEWELFVVNTYSMLRNVFKSGMSVNEAIRALDTDMELLTTYYEAYAHQFNNEQAHMLFIVPDYSKIPSEYLREHTGQKLEFEQLYKAIAKKLPQVKTDVSSLPNLTRHIAPCTTRIPHHQLATYIRQDYGHVRRVLLLDNCAIDLHVHRRITAVVTLIESYTGAVKHLPDFGTKINCEARIPFNICTHRLFGDSVHLKPLVTGRKRTELMELANKNKWYLKTAYEIAREARTIDAGLTDEVLNSLDL